MIDIHSHILPEVDDGSKSLEMSLEMGKIAQNDGITEIIATPHFSELFQYPLNFIHEKIEFLQEKFNENNINIKLHFGLEVQLDSELIDKFSDNIEELTINKQGKYILLELPFIDIPLYMNDIVRYFSSSGIIPIIVHPFRNARILQNPSILNSLRDNGARFQFDKGAVLNEYKMKTFPLLKKTFKKNFVHFIASDAHRTDRRRPTLKRAYKVIEKHFSKNIADKIFIDNPSKLLHGEFIDEKVLNNVGFFDKIQNIFNK